MDILIDIEWHKYYLKSTELYGKILFGDNEFLSTRTKWPPYARNEPGFFERLFSKVNGLKDSLHFFSTDYSLDQIDQIVIFPSYLDLFQLTYITFEKDSVIYYGPAKTKEEAEIIALEYFEYNIN